MKTKLIRSALLGLAALSTLALVSCQTSTSVPTSAVSCDKCGTVHFKAPSSVGGLSKGSMVTLKDSSRMTCPDCENQVAFMFKSVSSGTHVCKSCGGNLRHCTMH